MLVTALVKAYGTVRMYTNQVDEKSDHSTNEICQPWLMPTSYVLTDQIS